MEENKEPTTSKEDVEAHGPVERAPVESPAEERLADREDPDVEGHLLERSPTERPTESPMERAPTERPTE